MWPIRHTGGLISLKVIDMHARTTLPLLASMVLGLLLAPVAAAIGPDVVLTRITTGAGQPVMLAEPDDNSGRLFVVDRSGKIRIIDHGALLADPYFTITLPTASEQGLLGMAFDPDFASNGIFYLTFTAPLSEAQLGEQPDQVLARYTAVNPAANEFVGNRTDVLRIPDIYKNHNGGDIHFGPDGYLYWGMGDGGSGGDPNNFAQNLWHKTVGGHDYYLLGKMVRLDVRNGTSIATSETCGKPAGQTLQYKIPADNPFVATNQACDEIYQLGLRNPWRFSFDRQTNELYIADVGQGKWEEIDVVAGGSAGLNFGWNCYEGHDTYQPSNCNPAPPNLTGPVFDYSHSDPNFSLCSITGGYVYRGPDSELNGLYFYGDYCDSTLFYADVDNNYWHDGASGISGTPLSTNLDLGSGPVGFGEDLAGRVYVLVTNGTIYRIDSDNIFSNGFEL